MVVRCQVSGNLVEVENFLERGCSLLLIYEASNTTNLRRPTYLPVSKRLQLSGHGENSPNLLPSDVKRALLAMEHLWGMYRVCKTSGHQKRRISIHSFYEVEAGPLRLALR